jgi:hypothetical protein
MTEEKGLLSLIGLCRWCKCWGGRGGRPKRRSIEQHGSPLYTNHVYTGVGTAGTVTSTLATGGFSLVHIAVTSGSQPCPYCKEHEAAS